MANHHTRLTPRIVNTFFILALQQYFIHHDEYTWSPDDWNTQIDITTGYSEDGKTATTMPIVTVENGTTTITPAGVSTGMHSAVYRDMLPGRGKNNSLVDSKHDFMVNSTTEINIFCFTKDAADELAFEIAMFMMMLKYNVANIIQIQNIDTCSIIAAHPVDIAGWSNKWNAGIVFPYVFSVSKGYNPIDEGVLLKAIETTIKDTKQNCIIHDKDGNYSEFSLHIDNSSIPCNIDDSKIRL